MPQTFFLASILELYKNAKKGFEIVKSYNRHRPCACFIILLSYDNQKQMEESRVRLPRKTVAVIRIFSVSRNALLFPPPV